MVITGLSSVIHYFKRKQGSLWVQTWVPLPCLTCSHWSLYPFRTIQKEGFLVSISFHFFDGNFLLIYSVFYSYLYKHIFMYKYILYINIQTYKFLHTVIFNCFHLLSSLFISRTTEMAMVPIILFWLFSSCFCAGRFDSGKALCSGYVGVVRFMKFSLLFTKASTWT